MTLPTSKFGPVLLDPDRLAELSHKHVSFDEPHEATRRIPSSTALDGEYQDYKRKDAHKMALAYMGTNATKSKQRLEARPWKYDQKRVGLAPFGRSEGIYNATKNPYLKAAPVNEYRDSAANLEGGVLSTKQGQIFKAKRLQGLVQELNVRDSTTESLAQTVPTNSRLSDVTYSPPQSFIDVENAVNDVLGSISTNSYNSSVVDNANKLYRILQSSGSSLESADLVRLLRIVQETMRSVVAIMGARPRPPGGPPDAEVAFVNGERFLNADNVMLILTRIYQLLKGLISVSERSPKERKLALPTIIAASQRANKSPEGTRAEKEAFWRDIMARVGAGKPEGEESEEEDVEGGACACEEMPKPTKPRKRASKKKV